MGSGTNSSRPATTNRAMSGSNPRVTPQYTHAHEHPTLRDRSTHHRFAHRKADHHAGSVPALVELAGGRLQSEEQPGTADASERIHRENDDGVALSAPFRHRKIRLRITR